MMDVIRCNMCGKELSVRNDILMEDAIIISKKCRYDFFVNYLSYLHIDHPSDLS